MSSPSYHHLNNENSINTSANRISTDISINKISLHKWKFCFIHILIFIFLFIIVFINFIVTIDAFDDNKILTMHPDEICDIYIQEHNICLNLNRNITKPDEIIEECASSNLRLQVCYDQVKLYNRKCYMYLSEFEKCFRINNGESIREILNINYTLHQDLIPQDKNKTRNELKILREKCKEEVNTINICTSEYVTFDPFALVGIDDKNK
jgi:hypothetical protein